MTSRGSHGPMTAHEIPGFQLPASTDHHVFRSQNAGWPRPPLPRASALTVFDVAVRLVASEAGSSALQLDGEHVR